MADVVGGAARQSLSVRPVQGDIAVDQGHERSSLLGIAGTPEGECGRCLIAEQAAAGSVNLSAEYADEDVVVINDPESAGFFVLPRRHISSIEALPIPDRAKILAAVKRAMTWITDRSPETFVSVAVMDVPSGSEGHVCLGVRPSGTEDTKGSTSRAV